MPLISINSINGIPPYQVYICDINQITCVISTTINTTVPPNVILSIPPPYDISPQVLIKIVDSTGCQFTQVYSCVTPTPSPTVTPSITPTTSVTPTITPTPGTPTPTPTVTPTISVTPTLTPSTTVTPTVTRTPDPTPPPRPPKALLFIEPYSAANSIGDYMYNLGHNFYGFSNGTQPSLVFSAFTDEMRSYVEFSGWTTGTLPRIVEVDVPQVDGGVDSFGNPVFKYNFVTNVISANTIGEQAWYTWIIPTGLTNNQIQTEIELSINNPNVFVTNKTEPTIYQNTFLYVGGHITPGVYRVYTTFPSLNFQLFDNQNIYFKGGTVE
jgi:hypothetical protein